MIDKKKIIMTANYLLENSGSVTVYDLKQYYPDLSEKELACLLAQAFQKKELFSEKYIITSTTKYLSLCSNV